MLFIMLLNFFCIRKTYAVKFGKITGVSLTASMCLKDGYTFFDNYDSTKLIYDCSADADNSLSNLCKNTSSITNSASKGRADDICKRLSDNGYAIIYDNGSNSFDVTYETCTTKDFNFFNDYSQDYIKSCSESNAISFSELCKDKEKYTMPDVSKQARRDALCTKLELEENKKNNYDSNIEDYKYDINNVYFTENTPLCAASNQIGGYYSKDSIGNMSTGCSYIQEYGPIEKKTTYPGGPYKTSFTYKAKMFCSYISSYSCKFIQFLTGDAYWMSCSESSLPGSGSSSYSPSIDVKWNVHPERVILTEDINDSTKAVMKYVHESDEYNYSGISAPKLQPGIIRNPDLIGGYSEVEKPSISEKLITELGDTSLYIDSNNKTYQTITLEDGSVALNAYMVSTQSMSGTDNFTVGGGSYCSLGTFTDNSSSLAASYVTAYKAQHKDARAVCSVSTSGGEGKCGCISSETTTCPPGAPQGTMNNIVYNCSVSWVQTWNTYFLSSYSSYTVAETGRYELVDNYINFSGRFENIIGKLVPISTTTGDYNYIIYSENPESDKFGKRMCNLYVRDSSSDPDNPDPPTPPPYHWSELLDFRIVNTDSPFPGRQPRSNWKFDSTIIKNYINNSSNKVMYHIELTSEAMNKIKKNTSIANYTGWSLKFDYAPSVNGVYSWGTDHDYLWSIGGLNYAGLSTLTDLGAKITANKDVIINRNKELLLNGFNSYTRTRKKVLD